MVIRLGKVRTMSSSTNATTIQVPAEMVEHVRRLMEELSTEKPKRRRVEQEEEDEFEQTCEVKRITGHREVKGQLQFKLVFKQGEVEWVADSDCLCEWLISQYLASKGMTTAYIVCRVSTKEQAASTNLSMDGQEASIREAIPDGRYNRVKVIKIAQSAYKSIPQQLATVGEAANAGDGIFVYRVDRLSRNIEKFLYWLKDLDSRDVAITAVLDQSAMMDGADGEDGEPVNTTLDYRTKRLSFIQAVLDAEKEAAILSQKMKTSIKRRRERGDEHVGGLPYGKRFKRADDGTDRLLLVADEELYEAVDKVKRFCAGRGYWMGKPSSESRALQEEIASKLNVQGLRFHGKPWTRATIARLAKKHNIPQVCWK